MLGKDFFVGWWAFEDEWFWPFESFSKLKTAFCKYWTLIKINVSLTFVYSEYKVKNGTGAITGVSAQEIQINIGEMVISNSKCEKALGIHIDNKLTFESRVRFLCRKASQKLNAFARIACFLKFDQRRLLNAFITSQFSYAPVVWMFHNRKLNNHINRIHEEFMKNFISRP